MHEKRTTARRPPGTGCLLARRDKAGRETWYGKTGTGKGQVKKRLGRKRGPGCRDGLTHRDAEAALRQLITDTQPQLRDRLAVEEVGRRYVDYVETMGRKFTTVSDYRSILRVHLVPYFKAAKLDAITPLEIEQYITAKLEQGLSRKTVRNHLALLHGIFRYAVRHGWARMNPVALVDKPRTGGRSEDIRYLDEKELHALLAAVPADPLGDTERVLYLTAAMTGLRRGELLALCWRDVDWTAGVIRVRRSYTRGQFGTPKSRRGSRAVPMAERLVRRLGRHFQDSAFQAEDDLVFCHPQLGRVLDSSKLRKRFVEAAKLAGLRRIRFHDLRHTFGTRMAAAGAPMRAIQEWLGHFSSQTTEIYADYAPDSTMGAVWAQRAFSQLGSPDAHARS
jgi:integrase